MTDDMTIHRQLMRLHGFGLMKTILTQMSDTRNLTLLVRIYNQPEVGRLLTTGARVDAKVEDDDPDQDRGLWH